MDPISKIKDINGLLYTFLDKNVKILHCNCTYLTEAGQNYGSVMLKVDMKLERDVNIEELNLVAKICTESEYLKKVFSPEICFRNEIKMYTVILPILKRFQEEHCVTNLINFYPYCYATRNNLQNNEDVFDENSVLLMENLYPKGYRVVDRMESFDLETSHLILKDLATLHAVSIALKLQKPEEFFDKVTKSLLKRSSSQNISSDSLNSMIQLAETAAKLTGDDALIPKIKDAFDRYIWHRNNPSKPKEPFAAVIHNDFWINNIMLKFEDGIPVQQKMIDFQFADYGSPAVDLIFFLFTSVKLEILESHYNDLVQKYYNEFISQLSQLKCDVKEFSFDRFEDEMKESAFTREFFHLMLMVRYVHAASDKDKELKNRTEGDHFSQTEVTDLCLLRTNKILLHFNKNGWI